MPASANYRSESSPKPQLVLLIFMLVPLVIRLALAAMRRTRVSAAAEATLAVAVGAFACWSICGTGEPVDGLGMFLGALSLTAVLVDSLPRSDELRVRSDARRVFFVGCCADRDDLAAEMRERADLTLVGDVRTGEGERLDIGAVLAEIRAADPSVLVLSDEALHDEDLVSMASALNLAGVRIRDLRVFFEQEFKKVAASNLMVSWFLFDIAEIHRRRMYGWVKRALETVVSALLLLVTAPLFPVIMLAIKLFSPGPVFFRQTRVGKSGHVFSLTKFRTMHPDAEREHGEWATDAHSRTFRVGRLLRRLRLDELPQLWSVVRGQLSLVGPRPEQPAIVERLESEMQFYAARHCVRPGLTGWAQVNYGYGGSNEGAVAKLRYDLYYLKHQSLWLDLRIMALTARTVLFGSGS